MQALLSALVVTDAQKDAHSWGCISCGDVAEIRIKQSGTRCFMATTPSNKEKTSSSLGRIRMELPPSP